jgi:YD repeat-containing protein
LQAQNPWPGLFWYGEDQAHLFFGREAETQELLRLIQRETLTVLFGRSGLGKTSLLRAGVFPQLRQDGCFPVVLRLDYSQHAASPVEQVKALTEAAARESGIDIESAQTGSQAETLWEYFHRVHFWGPRNDRLTPVLVFDQFEEIFTLGNRRQEDAEIFEQLADLAENRIPAVVRQRAEASGERLTVESGVPNYKIVVSMREDFVWRLDSLRPILPAIMRNRFALGPLDSARGVEIIRNAGKQWVTDEVAQDIIEAVISSRRGEGLDSAAEEIEPAYLNVMCNELFERMVATGQTQITRELVAAEKGGILESLYERSLSGLDDSVRLFVEQNLVTPAGFRATMPVEEARREHISDADLKKLVDRRLLRFEDRLGTQHVELAHDLLTGLVEKSRKRREQVQLRHKLRQATLRAAIWAALTLAVIAGTAYYWLAYVHPSVSYYATFMRRNGSYELTGSLSRDEISHRAESLKVTRKGFRGEMQAIEAINGYGHLIMDSQLDSSLFFPTNGMNGQFCRLEFSYDEKGQAVHEVALDMNGRMVYALNYAPAQAEPLRNARRGSVVAADGTTVLSSFDIQYDPDGYVSEIQFTYLNQQFLEAEKLWSAATSWTVMNFGATFIDQKNTQLGTAEQLFLNPERDPIPANGGFVGKAYTRDARGELTETKFHDLKGNPVPTPDGTPPIVRWQNDKWGNQIEVSYFDAAGKPTIWPAGGFQKDDLTLDDHGSLKEEHFFGLDGKPVAQNDTGCYAFVYERDQSGYGTMKGCLDAQGAPMNQLDTGYQKTAYQYDASGRTIGNLYYDSTGAPVADKRTIGAQLPIGCYGWLWGYDQNFDRTVSACLASDGKAYSLIALHDLAEISHEVAFDFARAFDLDQQLVAQQPTPTYRLDLEEAALTDDQFDVCQTQAASIKDSDLSPPQLIVRDVLLLACQYASGKKPAARATAASLTGRLNQMSGGVWDFAGTRHYIQASSRFRAGSDAWDNLFLSLQKGDGPGATDALNQLQPVLKD